MADEIRKYALDVIERVMKEQAYAAILMRRSPIDREHMPFVSELVYTTLRNMTLLEEQWKPFVHGRIRPRTRYLLDMSACELFFMEKVPSYAVFFTSAELCSKHEKGFVNAVLHQMERRGLVKGSDPAVNTSHPKWLYRMWKAHYGEETAERIMMADQMPARVYGRINTLKTDRQTLVEAGAVFVNDISFTMKDNPLAHPLFQQGFYVIQDVHAAQAAVTLDVKPGMRGAGCLCGTGDKESGSSHVHA
jgi:16S rRNA (cytosine967-C5)-methyltransferase